MILKVILKLKRFSVKRFLCEHAVRADTFFFYAFAAFSLWYWLECVCLLYFGHGIRLSILYASDVFYDFYFALLTGYALLTFLYKRKRWGHVFVFLWVGTWVFVLISGTERSFGELEHALIHKITGMVLIIFFVRFSSKIAENLKKREEGKSCS